MFSFPARAKVQRNHRKAKHLQRFSLVLTRFFTTFATRLQKPKQHEKNTNYYLRHAGHTRYGCTEKLPSARLGTAREDADRTIRTHVAVVGNSPDTRVVPRCQVRHLGPLGTAVCRRLWRLDGPFALYRRFTRVQLARGALWTSIGVWFQGCSAAVQGREVGPRCSGRALQALWRTILLRTGQPPRQLRPVELQVPVLELTEHRPQEGYSRRLGTCCQEGWPAAGHLLPRRSCLDVVRALTAL